MIIGPYRTWLFDCDGVLLDSNRIKSAAFHEVARPFGHEVADAFVAHHVANGGRSRFEKFRYLLETLLDTPACAEQVADLASAYARIVRERLHACDETPGLRPFLSQRPLGCRWYVVTGGPEDEVREVLGARGLASCFDGVHGSPPTKMDILSQLGATGELGHPAVYFGDSLYDAEVARRFGIDFVFVWGASDVADWTRVLGGARRSIERLGLVECR